MPDRPFVLLSPVCVRSDDFAWVHQVQRIQRTLDRHHHVQVLYQEVTENRAMPFLGMGLCFINSKENLKHDFYYTRIQAQEFSGLIEGAVGNYFRKYLF